MADEQAATLLAAEVMEAETVSDTARGVVGWWKSKGLGRQFLTFLAASSLFDFGMSMFFLLYNLYLLDLGYREDFLGLMSSFSTAGSVTGTVLAVFLNRRVGLKQSVILCLAGMTLMAAVRSVVIGKYGLLGFTFVYGMSFGIWAVSFAVVIAQITTPAQRPFAYSIYIAILIGLAMIADPIAGRLPRWLNDLFGPVDAAQSKRWVLLLSCGIVALAVLPASRLQLGRVAARARTFYPRSSFIVRFLIALALLHVATSCFGPFASAYFARFLKVPVETIGFIFSGAQLAQVTAILLSPLILKKFGLIWGVVIMEGAAGLSLAILATGPAPIFAAFAFAGFMAFQYMDEPAMDTLLMSKVETHERSGASALMFLTIFASGAVTAPIAGVALTRFGYRVVILGGSLLLLLSAFLFGALLRERSKRMSGTEPEQESLNAQNHLR